MELLDRQPSENARSYALRVLLHNIITLELAPGSAVSENELSQILKPVSYTHLTLPTILLV